MTDAPQPSRVESVPVADGGIRIHAECFGDAPVPASSVLLLLSEAEAPCSRWPDDLVRALLAELDAVVRFDTRGTGRSSPVEPGYSLDDLASDAIGVLDHFGVESAHVLGRSMGGMIAQLLALDHPNRVRTLTLLSTTAGPHPQLAGPAQWLIEKMSQRLFEGPPPGAAARADWIVEQQEWFAGPRFDFDRELARRRAILEVRDHWRDAIAHGEAVVGAAPRYDRLERIATPTLVVHGTADPVHPVDHAQALQTGIVGAELRLIEGLGHELPDEFAPQLAEVVLGLVRREAGTS